jgi:plasmid stabilization system protein ParE
MVERIIWSRNAIEDKIRILNYWFRRIGSKTYSRKLNEALKESVDNLKSFPQMGRKLPDSDIRFIVKEHYQIFYRFQNSEIRILHVWDSRRNPDCLDLIIHEG